MRVIQQNFFFSVGNPILYLVTVSQTIILLRSVYNQHRKVQIKFGLKDKSNFAFFFLSLFLGVTFYCCQGGKESFEVAWLCWKSSLIVVYRFFLLCLLCFKFLWSTLYFYKIYKEYYFYLFYLFIKKDLCLEGFEKHIFIVCL